MRGTIFERYGGFAKVSRIVMDFYNRVLDTPQVSHYFAGTDMKTLVDHQTKFIASVMGGPAAYTNEQLERVHARLKISEEDFYEMVELLRETLEDYDMSDEDVDSVADGMVSRKNYIIARS